MLDTDNECKPDAKGLGCEDEAEILAKLKRGSYNIEDLSEILERHNRSRPGNERFWSFVGLHIESLKNPMAGYVMSRESLSVDKLFGFYLLCIGLALRLTKTSAEIFEWHVPKGGAAKTALPKTLPDAHNSA